MSTITQPIPASSSAVTYVESEDPHLFQRARTWWMLLALFLVAQGNGLFTRQDDTYWSLKGLNQDFESSPILQLLTAVTWVICAVLMFKRLASSVRLMSHHKALLAYVTLAFLSTLWSEEPSLTFRRAMLLCLAFLFAWFFADYYSPADQRRILIAAGVVVALASIAMAVLLPQYGISSGGEWKGVFGQKNRLGLSIFFLFSGLPFRKISGSRELLKLVLQSLLPLGLIVLSQSKTSLIMVVVLIVVRLLGPFIARARRDQLPFILYATAFAVIVTPLITIAARDIILPLLGRDSTLTGRTEHWGLLLSYAYQHFWLGYGYQAFWTGTGDSLAVIKQVGATMKGADSGYLDTMLQFGAAGMALLLVIFLVAVRDFLRLFRTRSVPLAGYWYASLIIATFVGSVTEILFLVPNGVITFVFVVGCAGLRTLSNESSHAMITDNVDSAGYAANASRTVRV
jgi:exopolysaccharide production protein ExoQ